MDRQIDPNIRRQKYLRRAVVAVAVVGFSWAAFAASMSWLRPSVAYSSLRTARVERGTIEVGFDATGVVVPASERSLSSPIDARLLRVLKRAGATVRAGEPLLELDTSASQLQLASLDDRIAQNQSQRLQLESQRDQNVGQLRSQLEQRSLDLEITRYKDQQNQKLRAEGLLSDEAARQSAVAVRKGEIELRQLDAAVAATVRNAAAQLASVDADLRTLRAERLQATRQLELARTSADRDGVLTWVAEHEGSTIRSGDVVAKIADLSTYRIEGSVSDVHASELKPGLPVKTILENVTLAGRIASIDPTVRNGTVRFYVDLDSGADERLRNSMRVELFVVAGSRSRTLKVKRGLFRDGVVFRIAEDGTAQQTSPRFGLSGADDIEIVEGLAENDEVVLSDMSEYAHVRALKLKGFPKEKK